MVTLPGRLFFVVMFSFVFMGGFFLNERVVAAQGINDVDTIAKVQEARDALNALDPSVFNKGKDKGDLTKKLDKVIKDLGNANYDKALAILENDIIDVMNGCDLIGAPDEDDKILDCVAQGTIFTLVFESINMAGTIVFNEEASVILQDISPGLVQNGNFNISGDVIIGGNLDAGEVGINGLAVIDNTGQWVGSPTGLVGPTGPAGATGTDGAIGPQGPMGIQGLAGAQGPAGAATGPQGPIGLAGADGDQGIQGPVGSAGADGADGIQGLQGIQGPSGADLFDHPWMQSGTNVFYNGGNVGIGTTSNINSLLTFPDGGILGANTLDGSDNAVVRIAGGGRDGEFRGGTISLAGNERSGGFGGNVVLEAGNVVDGKILFRTAAQQNRMVINNTGNVGIGTMSPAMKFQVNADGTVVDNSWLSGAGYGGMGIVETDAELRIISTDAGQFGSAIVLGQVDLSNPSDFEDAWGIFRETTGDGQGDGTLNFSYVNSSDVHNKALSLMTIKTDGKVGIGTALPTLGKLQVEDGANPQIVLKNPDSGGGFWSIGQSDTGWNSGGGKLVFIPDSTNSANAFVTFDNMGKVGIGTTQPSNLLHIEGADASTTRFAQQVDTGNNDWFGRIINPGGSANHLIGSNMTSFMWSTGAADFAGSGSSIKMMLTNTGKLGIGTITPGAKLDVAGDIKVGTVNDVGIVDGNTKVLVHGADNIVKYKTVSQLALQGPQGVQGTAGADGAQGLQGVQGIQGSIGLTGPSGTDGTDGSSGYSRASWPNWTTGAVRCRLI